MTDRHARQLVSEIDQDVFATREHAETAAFERSEITGTDALAFRGCRVFRVVHFDGDVGGAQRENLFKADDRGRVRVEFQRDVLHRVFLSDAGLLEHRERRVDATDGDTHRTVRCRRVVFVDDAVLIRISPIRTAHPGEHIGVGNTERDDVEIALRVFVDLLHDRHTLLEGKSTAHVNEIGNAEQRVGGRHAEQSMIEIDQDWIAARQHREAATGHVAEIARDDFVARIVSAVDFDGQVTGGDLEEIFKPDERSGISVGFQRDVGGRIFDAGLLEQRETERDAAERETNCAVSKRLVVAVDDAVVVRVGPVRSTEASEDVGVRGTNRDDIQFARGTVVEGFDDRRAAFVSEATAHVDELSDGDRGIGNGDTFEVEVVIEDDVVATGQHREAAAFKTIEIKHRRRRVFVGGIRSLVEFDRNVAGVDRQQTGETDKRRGVGVHVQGRVGDRRRRFFHEQR